MKILKYKELLFELIKREIKAKYKQSILGYAWVILVPIANLAVLSVVFSLFIRIPTGDIPYPMFLFAALVPWTFTANAILSGTNDLIANRTLITKIYIPREVFPASAILSKVVDFGLTSLVLIVFMYFYGFYITPSFILFPVVFLIHLLLVFGISFILSAVNVFFRDVENILGLAITIWMYVTPILYPLNLVPGKYLALIKLNPMTAIVGSYRAVFLNQPFPDAGQLIYSTVFSILIFIIGYIYFKNRSRYFADII